MERVASWTSVISCMSLAFSGVLGGNKKSLYYLNLYLVAHDALNEVDGSVRPPVLRGKRVALTAEINSLLFQPEPSIFPADVFNVDLIRN